MIRIKWSALFLFMVLAATTAQAQIAAPSLVPSAARVLDPGHVLSVPDASLTPDNPAVMVWTERKRFGMGQIQGVSDTDLTVNPNTSTDYSGNFAGFENNSKEIGFALEQLKLTGNSNDLNVTNFALAAPMMDSGALGFAIEHSTLDMPNKAKLRINSPVFGVSYRVADVVYLGVAGGTEEFKYTEPLVPTQESVRAVRKFGLAYSMEGNFLLHVEANASFYNDFASIGQTELRQDMFVAEVNFQNVHAGYQRINLVEENTEAGFNVFDIGYAKLDGLAVLLHIENGTRTDTLNNVNTNKYESKTVSVAYHF
ncbi:MAG: hypothetical protein OEZ59_03920 [Deltaproteobacteria bacterium]|nr:hypothetical protein [Deltaproteobacteria bacterium]